MKQIKSKVGNSNIKPMYPKSNGRAHIMGGINFKGAERRV
jgi:hypothetical protein